jgi:hypothetical protein
VEIRILDVNEQKEGTNQGRLEEIYFRRSSMIEPKWNEVDVLVAGGGPSGLIAATAAGRLGAKTLLIERDGFLGGMATAGLVAQFFFFYVKDLKVVRGIPEEFTERIQKAGGATGFEKYILMSAGLTSTPLIVTGFPFDPDITKIVADELVLDAGVHILFHSMVVDVLMEGKRVSGVIVEGVNGRREIRAKAFVDATGDAVLAKRAGAEVIGDEEDFRRARMPATLIFRVTDIDLPQLRALPREEKQKIVRRGLERGEIPWESLGFFRAPGTQDGFCLMSRISGLDVLNDEDVSQAEIVGRQQIKKIIAFLRHEVPGFQNCKIAGIAPRLGVRETRRIIGQYTLTDEDMFQYRSFEDAIAPGGSYVDIHDHSGPGIFVKELDRPFQIPMRCILPKSVEGLVMTGRSISTTRSVNGAIRGMGTMMALGQAAGTLASVAAKKGLQPHGVSAEEVQHVLRDSGAVITEEDMRK